MSENRNCGISESTKYDAMTTEELETILRLDADAPEGQELDTDTLLYIMGVLAERKKNKDHTEKTALEAYESFKQHYMPETASKPKSGKIRWLRSLSAVAAVLVIIFIGSITAKAFGLDIWEAVVTWTQETFHLSGRSQTDEPNKDGDLKYTSLDEVLISVGIDEPLVPTWIPDGYELTDITVEATPQQNVYNALYQNGTNYLKITVRDYLDAMPEYIEQSEDFVEIFEASSISYYLLSNNGRAQAVWIKDSFECHIVGDVTIDELKKMIDSI